MTKVVHFKKEPYDVYIGRPSKWGNPFSHQPGTLAKFKTASRQEAVQKYKEWILKQPKLLSDLHELEGKTLGCWCKPKLCHGDILVELINDRIVKQMVILGIDIETFSSVDLAKCGVYAYAEADDFEVLLFGYAFNDEPVQVIELAGGNRKLPGPVAEALLNPDVIKTAFNANFERTCLAKYFGLPLPPQEWQCSSVHALTLGLPNSLGGVAKALKLQQRKDTAGKALIRYFSVPCKPTKTNGKRTRNLPEHAPEKWEQFKNYCAQDVEVERALRKQLQRYEVLEKEQKLWQLDQRINDRGVRIDPNLVDSAIVCDTIYQKRLKKEAKELTGLDNPNSVAQLKSWLLEEEGLEVESLSKETVPVLLEQTENKKVQRVLELRQEMAKTSVKKYQAMERAKCSDDRIRGLLQFYGANRSGRWAGRLVQIQNLPKNELPDLDLARQLLKEGRYELLELLFESVPVVLSQLTRTAFIPSKGHRFIAADFSAIEARVIAWLAGEKWRMDIFNSHGKIYEASASAMFKVPVEEITKGSPLRQKGKIAELALGFQGGKGALISMGALEKGLKEEELPEIVSSWRGANPAIVQLWWDVERAAIAAVKGKTAVKFRHGIVFSYEAGGLFIRLPSGRRLTYVRPRMVRNEQFRGKLSLTYEGTEQGQWKRLFTFGGKLVENIVQAIARDCLAVAMLRIDDAGYDIAFHVHDEVVLDVPEAEAEADLGKVIEIMGQPISWAPGLPLKADAYEIDYYKKEG